MVQYVLLNAPLKVTHSFEYTINDHLKLTMAKKALLLPIVNKRTGERVGFYYDGPIGFTADFIVHTKKGAVGYTLERTYSSLFMFPKEIDFLIDYVKEIKPLVEEEFEERYGLILKHTKFSLSLLTSLNGLKGQHYLFLTKKPFSLWMIEMNKTFYISPPKIMGREGDNRLFILSTKEIIFTDNDKNVFSTANLHPPRLILRKLREWLLSLKPSPFTMLFKYFYETV